jgi:hypothetical protein
MPRILGIHPQGAGKETILMQTTRVRRPRTIASLAKIALPSVLLAVAAAGGEPRPAPVVPPPVGCAADLSYPLQVSVVPLGAVRGDSPVAARIEVSSRIPLDDVTVRVVPDAGVRVLATPAADLGLVRAGEARGTDFTVLPAAGAPRRTVEVMVEGTADGVRITGGAVLNLVFEPEPDRLVTDPDGETVHEVPARRIG